MVSGLWMSVLGPTSEIYLQGVECEQVELWVFGTTKATPIPGEAVTGNRRNSRDMLNCMKLYATKCLNYSTIQGAGMPK